MQRGRIFLYQKALFLEKFIYWKGIYGVGGRERKRQRQRTCMREISHPMVYSPNGHDGWGWAKPEKQPGTFFSPTRWGVGIQALESYSAASPGVISSNLQSVLKVMFIWFTSTTSGALTPCRQYLPHPIFKIFFLKARYRE